MHTPIYKNNKYCKIYFEIIKKAQNADRKKKQGIYYELHHIYPKSQHPEYSKSKWNLVMLTAKEHFICHHLLTKFTSSSLKSAVDFG